MIFMNSDKPKQNKSLSVISEDAIRLLTKINFLNDDDISSFEFEDYIDNSVLYFESRIAVLDKSTSIHYKNFNSMKRTILKELKTSDELNINIKMREPNDLYYKLPDSAIMRDFTNMTFDKIYDINTPIGKNIAQLYNLDYIGYNKATKIMTLDKITKSKDIVNLYDMMSRNVTITNKEQLEKYLNGISFPNNDLNVIKSYILGIIRELKYIKIAYKSDKSKKLVKCTNVVAALTMYRKNIINIMLNIYSVKLSILNLKPDLNESIDCVDDLHFNNPNIIHESIHLSEGEINSAISHMEFKEAYDAHMDRMHAYLDAMYEFGKRMIDNIDKLSIIPHGFSDALRVKKALYKMEDFIDKANPMRYIDNVASLDGMEINNFMEYLTDELARQRVDEFNAKKPEIISILDKEYKEISEWISFLKKHCYSGNKVSSIYRRPLNKLGVYSNDFKASIIREMQPLLGITREIDDYIQHCHCTDTRLAIVLNQIDKKFDNDDASYWKKKIIEWTNFLKIDWVNSECTGVEGIADMYSEFNEGNDILTAYLLYFKNKVYNF